MEIVVAVVGCAVSFLLGGLWTAWVMQRSLNRQTVIPNLKGIEKAKVFTPTPYDVERKNRELIKRTQKTQFADAEKEYRQSVGNGVPFIRASKGRR